MQTCNEHALDNTFAWSILVQTCAAWNTDCLCCKHTVDLAKRYMTAM